jgi:hypothetical protein
MMPAGARKPLEAVDAQVSAKEAGQGSSGEMILPAVNCTFYTCDVLHRGGVQC